MNCHECAQVEVDRPAVAICRYCSVGLCKQHLVEMHRSPTKPLYTCLHRPGRGFDTRAAETEGSRSPARHRAA